MPVILNNPFYILGTTSRDNRQRIVELAKEKSLETEDEELCEKARLTLTMPKSRIAAEINWLPGVSVNKISQIIFEIKNGNKDVYKQDLPNLTKVNIILELLYTLNFGSDELCDVINDMSDLFSDLDVNEIIKHINEDRVVAGFGLVGDNSDIEELLRNKEKECVGLIIKQLNNLPTNKLLEIVTSIVDNATRGGKFQASSIIDNIVDDYKLHTQNFLEQEIEKIKKIVEIIRKNANNKNKTEELTKKLISIIKNWDKVAQPIQLSMMSRGIDDHLSSDLAREIRELGVYLYNKHGYLEISQLIAQESAKIFAELPQMAESFKNDINALKDLSNPKIEFDENLRYEAEIGIIFKDKLIIDKNGLIWKGTTYPFDKITHMTWWAVSRSVNGISTGTVYSISIKSDVGYTDIETRRSNVFADIIDRLWKASGLMIMANILQDLSNGKSLTFNNLKIHNDGVTLVKSRWFGADESKKFSFRELNMYSQNGQLIIMADGFKECLQYKEVYNLHFVENILKIAINERLSSLNDLN